MSIEATMSALGQKQTFAAQKGMSALPPKADMSLVTANRHEQFRPVDRVNHLLTTADFARPPDV